MAHSCAEHNCPELYPGDTDVLRPDILEYTLRPATSLTG